MYLPIDTTSRMFYTYKKGYYNKFVLCTYQKSKKQRQNRKKKPEMPKYRKKCKLFQKEATSHYFFNFQRPLEVFLKKCPKEICQKLPV